MTDVTDLMARAEPAKPSSIHQRIDRRIEVLTDWLENGVPREKIGSLPVSLTAAREWEDETLGIARIPSPRTFTKNHQDSDLGAKVCLIEGLLTDIRQKWATPRRKKSARGTTAQPEPKSSAPWSEHIACEKCLKAHVDKYHMMAERLATAVNLSLSHEARLEDKDEEINRLNKELANERRAAARRPRPV
ncbi:hypothetical protein CP98_03723 [Sphingobium yanoikuyae]|uniref:Uncharacterized protein n=1 Tax=Sphingobium yanoikuyae TaxID=13690 RepID=A0A084EGY1_SPHYA|nr:hypothetical protein [Sphingobium yanoikuyae]KEZ17223.1 hypothetical protein CP98_03723 [Sphingobium yanoikuyae]